MIEQSESIAALAKALAKTQATIEGAVKGKANPAFKGTKYADLKSVWEACREQLVTNGLSIAQFPGEMIANSMTLTTQLSHESGEWMRATLSIPLSKVDAQGYGSAVTYARRYALAAVVGVCPEDDDGNAAVQRPANDVPERSAASARSASPPLAGPYTSKTALWAAVKAFDRELRGCGDLDTLLALLATPDATALMVQVERDAPQLAHGGKDLPAEFEPLHALIARMKTDLQAAETDDSWKRDVTRAG